MINVETLDYIVIVFLLNSVLLILKGSVIY